MGFFLAHDTSRGRVHIILCFLLLIHYSTILVVVVVVAAAAQFHIVLLFDLLLLRQLLIVFRDEKHLTTTRTRHGKSCHLLHQILKLFFLSPLGIARLGTGRHKISLFQSFVELLAGHGGQPTLQAMAMKHVLTGRIAGPTEGFIGLKGRQANGAAVGHLPTQGEIVVVVIVVRVQQLVLVAAVVVAIAMSFSWHGKSTNGSLQLYFRKINADVLVGFFVFSRDCNGSFQILNIVFNSVRRGGFASLRLTISHLAIVNSPFTICIVLL
mmetsp:Transcript_1400/g.3062  ORF Transcript_1400/g.3062 Transcript_1400/m.3062 type:complete len:268 (-) Transcript_1400:597-1400(-)